ncbi:hypothetical protein EDB92DRAFT_2106285 [Lactarius akahatsu]|uniref:Uncharacterized protein n=1 Tax=Lactarius akahatsu TaxID=416441 RepID=A0AAD4Q4E1_9AGAM|nr:hypothetical protein EDB92DRAFT_2106285 [Lactarius akahatsu]
MHLYAKSAVYIISGSHVIARYVKSSHQNDPGRTVLEILLAVFFFAIRTLPQSRTRADNCEKPFVQFSEKEVDELVDEWTPEPHSLQKSNLASVPMASGANGPSYNFTGLAIEVRAILETLRKYGVGSCGPPGFYGTTDFLGTEASMGCQCCYTERLANFSRSTIRCSDHNDLKCLDDVLLSVEKERRKRRGPLTRRFILTEGIFEKDGAMVDLPRLKQYALILTSLIDRAEARSPPRMPPRRSSTSHLRPSVLATSVSAKPSNPATPAPCEAQAPSFNIVGEERVLQDIVDEAVA